MGDSYNTRRKASTDNASSVETIGIDDGPFDLPGKRGKNEPKNFAPLVAVYLRGPHLVGAEFGRITTDGLDGTTEALRLLRRLPRRPVLLSGVTFGGFNLINPRTIYEQRDVPVIVVIGSRPNNRAVKRALLSHFSDWKARWKIISSLGPIRSIRTIRGEPPIYYEHFGCSSSEARRFLSMLSVVSRVPEPLRVAGIVARGLFSD